MKGYIVVFEGDDESGYSAYSPDLPGVVAAADTRHETVVDGRGYGRAYRCAPGRGGAVPEPAEAERSLGTKSVKI